MTPLFLQAPYGQGTQSNTAELKCGHTVLSPSLMEQLMVLAKIQRPVHSQQLPAPSLGMLGPTTRTASKQHQPTLYNTCIHPSAHWGAQDTNLPSSRSLRGPYLSMTIPSGSVIALSRKDPMVKAKLSISSWALQEGHLCSESVPFSWSGLLVAFSTWGDKGSLLQCVRMRLAVMQEGKEKPHIQVPQHPENTPFTLCIYYNW